MCMTFGQDQQPEVDRLKAELAIIEEAIRDYYDAVNAGGDQYAAAAFALGRIQTAVGMPPGHPAATGDEAGA